MPEYFWRQVLGFILGAVFAPLLILAAFGIGGSLPISLMDGSKWLLGFGAYLLPVVLIILAIEIFRDKENGVSRSVTAGVLLFFAALSGFAHLFVERGQSLAVADKGEGGGFLGHITDSLLLTVLDKITAGIVLSAIGLVSILFIARVPLSSFFSALTRPFKKKPLAEDGMSAAGVGEVNGKFKLNEGVPIEKSGSSQTAKKTTSGGDDKEALTTIKDPQWKLPDLDLLNDKQDQANPGDVEGNADIIQGTLSDFGIKVAMEGANVGPRVTQYTLRPPAGVKLSRITSLDNNLALNLAAESIRMEAPIPGKRAVGIEVPNQKAATVRIHSVISSDAWKKSKSPLTFVLGKDITGKPVVDDLDNLPHLLIAGATGSGKSIMINSLLTSLLYRNSPSELKLILVDPKRVELSLFDNLPHLLTPVITEADKTVSALKWAVAEMERRYASLKEVGRRNIGEYNRLKKEEGMPYIVIVIDELADLMMAAARDVEALVVRLAQKSRAVGIHLVVATQRPSVDVITGLIKANVPARIAFTVTSQVDSRTIIDGAGAERLLGTGDMLYKTPQIKPMRIQGALIEREELVAVTDYIRMQRAPEYDDEVVSQPVNLGGGRGSSGTGADGMEDSLFQEAVQVVLDSQKASTTLLQLRLHIGYARAARIIETMESRGIIGQADGNRPREILISSLDEIGAQNDQDDI